METGLQAYLWYAIYDSDGRTSLINFRMSPTGAVNEIQLSENFCSIRVYGVCSLPSSKIMIRKFASCYNLLSVGSELRSVVR
jgi:hypothetical protein